MILFEAIGNPFWAWRIPIANAQVNAHKSTPFKTLLISSAEIDN